ncbi:MAG: tripartite tricarboxylate transporter substrate binding protein [Betaproteobacteria bacterium]|nr:tripartite tricarboxylate transporter substrate binding protein [Betaproteobacteria bacterium]
MPQYRAMTRLIRLALATLCCGLQALAAIAQDYPTKSVRLIIPFPPGGSNDIVGRMLAMQLSERLGKPIIVDNRGGAGGVIGTELAAKAPPDGYTLLLISTAFALNTSLYKLPYDPATAFTPVASLGTGPNVLVVNAKLPVQSVKELIALAKAKPGQLNYASAGVGSFQHLGGELFRIMAGIDVVHVPFKGGAPATTDVIAGSTQYSLGSLINMIPHIRAGSVRALGIGGAHRSPLLPDVPTIAEAGVPNYDAANWWGILASAGTPPAIVRRLHAELTALLKSVETRKRLDAEGAQTLPMSSEAFGKLIASETAKWARVIQAAGIKPE